MKYCWFVYMQETKVVFFITTMGKIQFVVQSVVSFSLFYLLPLQTSFMTLPSIQYPLQPLFLKELGLCMGRMVMVWPEVWWVIFQDGVSGV